MQSSVSFKRSKDLAVCQSSALIKTGTLTQNKMTVENYYVNGESVCSGEIDLKDSAQRELLMFSMLCNDSTNQNGQEIGDPTETALINLGSLLGEDYAQVREEYPRLSEVPFDSDRKLMSTEHFIDGRYVMVVKGAVDVLLERMSHIQDGDTLREITEEDRVRIELQNRHFSENGLRVLAFAFKTMEQEQGLTLNDENDLTFLGLISMMDPPRVESKDAVAECIKAGIKPIMITGDHKVTAAAIAKTNRNSGKICRKLVKVRSSKTCRTKNSRSSYRTFLCMQEFHRNTRSVSCGHGRSVEILWQ